MFKKKTNIAFIKVESCFEASVSDFNLHTATDFSLASESGIIMYKSTTFAIIF